MSVSSVEDHIKIGYCNADSILCNLDNILAFLCSNKLHILAVSETWLIDTDMLEFPGYKYLRNDRCLINLDSNRDTKGGGVAFIIHNSLQLRTLAYSKVKSIGETEFLLDKVIPQQNTSLLVGVVKL